MSAYGGVLAWSRRDLPAGAYHLVLRAGGVVRDAPVAASSLPFDPDLGPAGGGRVAVVYERCRPGLRRCDVYRLYVARGRERRVRAISSRRGSERVPSIWDARYAFARETALRDGLFTARGRHVRFLGSRPVTETDLHGRSVAFATLRQSRVVDVISSEIWLQRMGRRACRVARGDEGDTGGTALGSPVFDGSYLYWHDSTSDPLVRERVARLTIAGGCGRPPLRVSYRELPIGVDSIAVDRGAVFYTQGDYVGAPGVLAADGSPGFASL